MKIFFITFAIALLLVPVSYSDNASASKQKFFDSYLKFCSEEKKQLYTKYITFYPIYRHFTLSPTNTNATLFDNLQIFLII